LRRLARQTSFYNGFALIETAALELLSRLHWMNYCVYAFQKQG
jgi:hypothetical protein